MDVLNNILELMKKKGISQKELCEKLGINQQAFTNWKNGTHSSYTKYLPQIADILGCSMDFLVGKDHQNAPSDDDLSEYLEELRTRPEMKMLFNITKKATRADVEKAVKVIEAMLQDE